MKTLQHSAVEPPPLPDLGQMLYRHSIGPRQHEILSNVGARAAVDYAELWSLAMVAAANLALLDIGAGDRVALVMDSSIDVIALLLGILQCGAVLVPIQPLARLDGRSETAKRVLGIVQATGVKLFVIPEVDHAALHAVAPDTPMVLRAAHRLLEGTPRAATQPALFPGGSHAIIQFSSGSTGTPKGVCLTRDNLSANLAAINNRMQWRPEDRIVSWLPFYHDLGLIGVMLSSLWAGCTAQFYAPSEFVRHPIGWLRRLSDFRATMTAAPQFAYSLCLAKAQAGSRALAGLDLSNIRNMLNGSEFIHWTACKQFQEAFAPYGLAPHVVQPAYGLAENGVGVTLRPPGAPVQSRRIARAGIPGDTGPCDDYLTLAGNGSAIDGTELCIRDNDGHTILSGELGDIYFRGTSATSTYMLAGGITVPCKSADGWVATGDIGTIIDGELYVAGRRKEIFKRGGRTFAPPDIEHRLAQALDMAPGDIVAFAFLDDELANEKLVVIVEMGKSALVALPADFAVTVKRQALAAFQFQVDHVYAIGRGRLPRTSSGKIQRTYLSSLASSRKLVEQLTLHALN